MATGVDYPFQVDDDDDHCETSPEAYEDVEEMLGALAEKLGKTRAELAIYDPYFCTGQVVQNLGATPLPLPSLSKLYLINCVAAAAHSTAA